MEDYLPSQPLTDIVMTKPKTPAQNLLQLVKQLIEEEQYEGVALLFTSEPESARNLKCMEEISMNLLHDVCLKHLKGSKHETNYLLYNCVENLLKVIATHAPPEELLLELLELVEEQKSEYVFTSTLRALQIVLLRMSDKRPRALEWSLNSIQTHLEELPLPKYLKNGYDLQQERLLEQEDQVQSFLMHYITVGLFYEPLLKDISKQQAMEEIFRTRSINRRNVLCCFLMQLLGKPLSLLDLTIDNRNSNTYTVQCARSLTQGITQCICDPFYFLSLAESRMRLKHVDTPKDFFDVDSNSNIFLIKEKLPLDSLAIYIYMVLVEGVDVGAIPKVYAPLYIFEAGFFLVTELIIQDEVPLQYRGVLLGQRILNQLYQIKISAVCLELEVHKIFCFAISKIAVYSPLAYLRIAAVELLKKYILAFDHEGTYLLLKNLLPSVSNTGLMGLFITMYRDVVRNALWKISTPMPSSFCGNHFRSLFLNMMCHLPQGAKTDLLEHLDHVLCTLNAVRVFAMNDKCNRTGFWDLISDIEHQFMQPLRDGLNLSIAHYKAELKRVGNGLPPVNKATERKIMELLNVSIANAKPETDLDWTPQCEVHVLKRNICSLELALSLLSRSSECLEAGEKLYKSKQGL